MHSSLTNPKFIIPIAVLLLCVIGGCGGLRIIMKKKKTIKRESLEYDDANSGISGNAVFIPSSVAIPIRICADADAEIIRRNCSEMVNGDTLWLTDGVCRKLSAYGCWKESFVCNIAEYFAGRLEVIKPREGDRLDLNTMEPDEDLTAECEVKSVVDLGLMDIKTGNVIHKAFVTVKQV